MGQSEGEGESDAGLELVDVPEWSEWSAEQGPVLGGDRAAEESAIAPADRGDAEEQHEREESALRHSAMRETAEAERGDERGSDDGDRPCRQRVARGQRDAVHREVGEPVGGAAHHLEDRCRTGRGGDGLGVLQHVRAVLAEEVEADHPPRDGHRQNEEPPPDEARAARPAGTGEEVQEGDRHHREHDGGVRPAHERDGEA